MNISPKKTADIAEGENLFAREYKDGHKTLNSKEAKAITELLVSENKKRDAFLRNLSKDVLGRPRNPLNGEETPRNIRGEPIMNSVALIEATNKIPLMNKDMPYRELPKKMEPLGKIGVNEENYRKALGNSVSDYTVGAAQPVDLFARTKNESEIKAQTLRKAEMVADAKKRASAQRHEQHLIMTINQLRSQLREKESELDILRNSREYNGGSRSDPHTS